MKNFIKKGSSHIENKVKSIGGFTLVELLVVIALIVGVGGALVPAVRQ